MGTMPAATAARMSHVESPTYQHASGAIPSSRAPSSSRSGAGLACSTWLPSTIRGSAGQVERRDRRRDLLAPRRGGDGPGEPPRVEGQQHLSGAGQRPRVSVARVEELAAATVDLLRIVLAEVPPAGLGGLACQVPSVHADHRLQLCAGGGDAGLLERHGPRVDASRHRVDQRAVQVEQDALGAAGGGHRSYDTGPMPSEFAPHWTLDPGTVFLNHGSFGATPRSVLAAQAEWRERMEREPVAFFARDLEPAMDEARAALGAFVGADPDDLALVPNATAGINIVARSLDLRAGDEVIALDHAYNAATNVLEHAATAAGARLVIVRLPFPGATPDLARDVILDAVTPRTRLVMIDHVTSATALVLPVAEIVAALASRGVDALVDGAHAPGMLDVDIGAIGAAYYAGNCHKWLSAPRARASSTCGATSRSALGRWRSATAPIRRAPAARNFASSTTGRAPRTHRHISASRPQSSSARRCCRAAGQHCASATATSPFGVATCCAPPSGSTRRRPPA